MSRSKSPRPLSGGVWSVLAWLRRDDRGSTETLSSEGSARTAASFAFLHPAGYPCAAPVVLQPPPSPTDSYKKRVRDGDCRRQYERDLTIHRKYLLPLGESHYTSLPPTRRSGEERERRATSESLRRAAHVPGKRRAPPPPITSTLRRRTYKGPAPRPPMDVEEPYKNKMFKRESTDLKKEEHKTNQIKLESYNINTEQLAQGNETITKETKTEQSDDVREVVQCNKKETKIRQDKSFLKQIFEIRSKRNSAIDIPPVKLLPSISELDKQAAELLKSYKLKAFEQNNNVSSKTDANKNIPEEKRFCTRCLKKYDATMVTCLDCLSEAKASTDSNKYRDTCLALKHSETQTNESVINAETSKNSEDKQKLKEMLKEMKDSLAKKAKPDKSDIKKSYYFNNTQASDENIIFGKETPTLPIGSSLQNTHNQKLTAGSFEIKEKLHSSENILNFSTVVTTSTTVINQSHESVRVLENKNAIKEPPVSKTDENVSIENHIQPLKLSTLLNPVYIPKKSENKTSNSAAKESFLLGSPNQSTCEIKQSTNKQKSQLKFEQHVVPSCSQPIINSTTSEKMLTKQNEVTQNKIHRPSPKNKIMQSKHITPTIELNKTTKDLVSKSFTPTQGIAIASTSTVIPDVINNVRLCTDQHSKRRDLINQLEKSIATGDEQAAAEAAIKLAQLRLSCSVLSFSSQIIANTSIVSPIETVCNTNKLKSETTKLPTTSCKVDSGTQSEETIFFKMQVNKPEKRTEVIEIDNKKHTKKLDNALTKLQKENNVVTETKTLVKDKPGSSISENAPLVCAATEVKDKFTTVEVWIEDREAARGPVRLEVSPEGSLGALRRAAEETLGLPQRLQRWIIGRTLCTQDDTPLISLAGPALDAPFYLCLVESEATKETEAVTSPAPANEARPGTVYTELLELERQALVRNTSSFECAVCLERCGAGAGVVLRECLHEFCGACLAGAVRHSAEARVRCPARECGAALLEREARALPAAADHERRLARALAAAAAAAGPRSVHCRTSDCAGWALRDDGVDVATFRCPLCDALNCLSCQAIHEGETCEEHRSRLERAAAAAGSSTDADADGTAALLAAMKARGEALECPSCGALLTKQWGCDWVRCAACRTEICWATRGRRWGPAGKGDLSGGCRCGLDSRRCHPSCGYCH